MSEEIIISDAKVMNHIEKVPKSGYVEKHKFKKTNVPIITGGCRKCAMNDFYE